MPFFFPHHQQQASLAAERQDMDIFQLLSLLDSSSPQCQPRRQNKPAPTFTPNFDILETASAYELFGEVPGLNTQTLDIQFEDAQTIVLKGRTDRPSASVSAPAAAEEKVQEKEVEQEVTTPTKNATVEDAAEEEDYDEVDTPLTSSTVAPSTATATAAPTVKPAEKAAATQATPKSRFWLSERRTGSFARSFSFAQRIEIDDVTAELKEGVLHVVVPKSVKSRKVAVSVN